MPLQTCLPGRGFTPHMPGLGQTKPGAPPMSPTHVAGNQVPKLSAAASGSWMQAAGKTHPQYSGTGCGCHGQGITPLCHTRAPSHFRGTLLLDGTARGAILCLLVIEPRFWGWASPLKTLLMRTHIPRVSCSGVPRSCPLLLVPTAGASRGLAMPCPLGDLATSTQQGGQRSRTASANCTACAT